MRYSEPYSIPQRPIGEYYRYVNGNPVSGTEGSIPPATAFDEPMAEIQNVIIQVGLTPTHDDLTQLWQALLLLTQQKYITTAIIKTVHGATADFPDLIAALMWLEEYIITASGSVTFMVAPGKWTYTGTVEINHPNSNRVFIQGSALKGGSPDPANVSCTGYHNSTDGTNQIIYLRSIYSTELAFTGGVTGFRCLSYGVTFRYLLITGSQDALGDGGGRGIDMYQDVDIDGVSIWGFGDTGILINHCTLIQASALTIMVSFCAGYGMQSYGGMYLSAGGNSTLITSSNRQACFLFAAWMWVDTWDCRGNGINTGGAAVQLYCGSELVVNATLNCSYNAEAGLLVQGSCTVSAENSSFSYNGGTGFYMEGGTAWIDNSSLVGNAVADAASNDGAFLEMFGCTYTNIAPAPYSWSDSGGYIVA